MNKFFALFALFAAAVLAISPLASRAAGDHGDHGKKDSPAMAADMTDGEVRKVDMDSAKLTLEHADIKSLDMPAMTMVFVVKDKAMLESVKVGDKVRFKVINDAGKFTITDLRVVR